MPLIDEQYAETIKDRGKTNRIYQKHQAIGLEIAELLDDKKHVALYMKLCRTQDQQFLVRLAKSVAEKKDVKNKGAYFMKMMKEKKNTDNNVRS